jgi:hypothetical protein
MTSRDAGAVDFVVNAAFVAKLRSILHRRRLVPGPNVPISGPVILTSR